MRLPPVETALAGQADATHARPGSRGFASQILFAFLACLPLVALSDIPESLGAAFFIAKLAISLLLLLTLALPLPKALLLLLALGVSGGDVALTDSEDLQTAMSASIWLFYLGPFKPSWIVFSCILAQFLKIRRIQLPAPAKLLTLWFASVPWITSIAHGGLFGPHAATEVIVDLKMGAMLLAAFTLFYSGLRDLPSLQRSALALFLGGLMARHLVDFFYVMLNVGPEIVEGVSRGSLDSAKGGATLLAYFGTLLLFVHGKWILGAGISIISIIVLAAYGTRMLWITLTLGIIILLAVHRLRRRISFSLGAAAFVLMGAWGLQMLNPQSAEYAFLRYQTITRGRDHNKFAVEVDYNPISRIDPIRYAEILNIHRTTTERLALLWGSGYGGFYHDDVIHFPRQNMGSSFPIYSHKTGMFYRAHFFPAHLYLKHGIIGLLLISSFWLMPAHALFKLLRRQQISKSSPGSAELIYSAMQCVLAFFATTMLELYWSGKGLFFSGFLIALVLAFLGSHGDISASSSPNHPPRPRMI